MHLCSGALVYIGWILTSENIVEQSNAIINLYIEILNLFPFFLSHDNLYCYSYISFRKLEYLLASSWVSNYNLVIVITICSQKQVLKLVCLAKRWKCVKMLQVKKFTFINITSIKFTGNPKLKSQTFEGDSLKLSDHSIHNHHHCHRSLNPNRRSWVL